MQNINSLSPALTENLRLGKGKPTSLNHGMLSIPLHTEQIMCEIDKQELITGHLHAIAANEKFQHIGQPQCWQTDSEMAIWEVTRQRNAWHPLARGAKLTLN